MLEEELLRGNWVANKHAIELVVLKNIKLVLSRKKNIQEEVDIERKTYSKEEGKHEYPGDLVYVIYF